MFPSPVDLLNPGIEPRSPTLQADSLPSKPRGKQVHPKPEQVPEAVLQLHFAVPDRGGTPTGSTTIADSNPKEGCRQPATTEACTVPEVRGKNTAVVWIPELPAATKH